MRRPRARWMIVGVIAAAALLTPAAIALAGQSATGVSAQGLLWVGDPARGTRVFDGLERAPGTITVANDPLSRFGRSFRYETWDNPDGSKERCESRGLRRPDGSVIRIGAGQLGQTFYLGWRALWAPMPTTRGRWISFWQLHWSGAGPGGGPMTIRTLGDGMLHVQYVSPDGRTDRNIWSTPLRTGVWHSFVVGIRLSRSSSDGFIEFWYDGQRQRFVNGTDHFMAALFKGDHVNYKWGVYRSGPNRGHAVEYVNNARLGTSFADVAQ